MMLRRAKIAPLLLSLFSLVLVGSTASMSEAAPVTLTDQNSVVEIDPASQAGMYTWQVDGTDNLFQRWFWYRIGAFGQESSIDTISPAVVTGFGGGQDGKLTYENAAFRIEVKYSLVGGATGSLDSDLGEQIRITNKTHGTLDFHFFEYTDFDLNGTASDDTASLVSPTAVLQTDGNSNIVASESLSVTPAPNRHEINIFSATRDSLNDGSATTLNNSPGPVGPGDVTWAFEWDIPIAGGNSVLLSKSLKDAPAAVPEPASLLVFGLGIVALRRRERTRVVSPR
jgi:hypothetical protein